MTWEMVLLAWDGLWHRVRLSSYRSVVEQHRPEIGMVTCEACRLPWPCPPVLQVIDALFRA